jgi:sugar lactone lactonase YvrE
MVTARGDLYFADAPNHHVELIDSKGNRRVVHDGIFWPRGLQASTDQSLLMVNDPHTKWIWSFHIEPDGSLANGQAFYHLETPDEASETEAEQMAFDTDGFLYVGTNLGVQVCDQAGRVNAIINPPPGSASVGNVLFAGPDFKWLYGSDGERWFRRQVKRQGAASWHPVKPPQPRL